MRRIGLLLILALLGCGERAADTAVPPDLFAAEVGAVSFPVGCAASAAELVQRGVVLLHHMMYESARLAFGMAEAADADCAMALWGQAMTLIHPLWPDRPSPEVLRWGGELAGRAATLASSTPRERRYLATVAAYFANKPEDTEQKRLARFHAAWRELVDDHPEDLEAYAFFALAHMATADPSDKTYAKQRRAGKIAQEVLALSPEHPGGHHYLIHAYDNPALAADALTVADRYGALTPEVPHATHMMTHIYTRLGEWQKSIEWNRKSADSAWDLCVDNGEITAHYQHALDYLAYAYLQLGADSQAAAVVADAQALQPPYSSVNRDAAAYAFAALPARYHLERGDWRSAAGLAPKVPASFPWEDGHLPYIATSYFAKALGHARLGELAPATAALGELRQLQGEVRQYNEYWSGQVEIQARSVSAWIEYVGGNRAVGLDLMRQAAAHELATEKSPVTPGEVVPATELLADMLLDAGRADEAFAAYQSALERTPGRLRSLFGAATAAQAAGRDDAARTYYQAVTAALAGRGERPDMKAAANAFLKARA